MADENECWSPTFISDDSPAKVVDVYKMYSDRITALRNISALTIPIILFSLKIIVDAGSKNAKMSIFGVILTIIMFATVVFIRIKVNHLVSDYEDIVDIEHRRAYRLLPIDSLMSAADYLNRGTEASKFWTFTKMICAFGSAASTLTLLVALRMALLIF